MKHSLFLCLLLLTSSFLMAQKPAYQLFNTRGKQITYDKMLKELTGADVVFFGELHNNPIAHWLQIEVAQSLFAEKGAQLVLGAEMFEADNQLIMNEYLANLITEDKFETEARLWPNYSTDYKPLVAFAKANALPFVATNIPRRYASMVHKKGLESLQQLSAEAKRYIAPLPIAYDAEVACYKNMLEMSAMMGHANENLPKAQAIKDATMAHFILENYSAGQLFLHFNGSYHSDNHEGIVWYLKQQQPDLKIVTISTVMQTTVSKLDEENQGVADFIICTPENMTPTH